MAGFGYDAAIIAAFPGVVGGVIHATGLSNDPSTPLLHEAFLAEQQEVQARLGDTPLASIPSLAAWRRVFSTLGVKPTQYRSAAESLLRRLTKQGDIPSINTLVDLANLVSIRHALPVAVFDQVAVTGTTTVRFATGDEPFTDLGSDSVTHPIEGEVIFVDEAPLVSARRWCWRQSAQSAAGLQTTEALITVEGHHDSAERDVAAAVDDILALLQTHQPDERSAHAVLSAADPRFDFGS
jgi:DNA/RNA-binding domain of Phe-tRNA-synthetase-like protein